MYGKSKQTSASKTGDEFREFANPSPPRRPGDPLPGNAKDMETLIKEGLDPIHAAYAYIQQITARFAEGVSQFPEMKDWSHAIEKLEEEYMPAGPPMSPLRNWPG